MTTHLLNAKMLAKFVVYKQVVYFNSIRRYFAKLERSNYVPELLLKLRWKFLKNYRPLPPSILAAFYFAFLTSRLEHFFSIASYTYGRQPPSSSSTWLLAFLYNIYRSPAQISSSILSIIYACPK